MSSINLTLTELFVDEGNLKEAEKYLEEGKAYANLLHNEKDIDDHKRLEHTIALKHKDH